MTSILVRTLADSRSGARLTDATITATATRARADGTDIVLPEPVTVRLRKGTLSAPLELEAPDGTWAWRFVVKPSGARLKDAVTILHTFAGAEVEWADMTPVDPATLEPLDPIPPSAQEILLRAGEAIVVAEEAVEQATDTLSVANTAVVSGTVQGDNLILGQKNGGTINAGNVRGLPGLGTARTDRTAGIAMYTADTVAGREQLIYGDTGLRRINTETGQTGTGNVYVRRVGYLVTIYFVNAVFGILAGTVDLPALPSGFRPRVNSNGTVFVNSTPNRSIIISNGIPRLYGLTAGAQVDGTLTFQTENPWPTTLPGDVISTPPYN